MRKILSYFGLFITSYLWLHTNIRLWASAKDRLFLFSRPVWDGVAEPSFTADTRSWIWCWLQGMDKTSPAHLTEWWRHQNQVLSFHSALLHRVIGFLFSFGYTTASKFPSLLQTAGSRQVLQDFQITCMLKEEHAHVWSHTASIKEQFMRFPRMAAAGDSYPGAVFCALLCGFDLKGWRIRTSVTPTVPVSSPGVDSLRSWTRVLLFASRLQGYSPWHQLLSSSMAPNQNQPGPCFQTIPPSIPPIDWHDECWLPQLLLIAEFGWGW